MSAKAAVRRRKQSRLEMEIAFFRWFGRLDAQQLALAYEAVVR
jgi:hypothetical protein